MKKWVCSVCGYVHYGDEAPETCPVCKQPKEKFTLVEEQKKNPYDLDNLMQGVKDGYRKIEK